jgi:gamma-glutamylcyclotransferase (GGCT)/AIG2-like uncharacterized protein YtfP
MFVYGTLKEGRPLDRDFFAKTRLSVQPATIVGDIYHLNWYPGMKLGGDNLAHGEIHEFELQDMKVVVPMMDAIEGYSEKRDDEDNLFSRRIVKAKAENGEELDVYVYEFNGKVEDAQRVEDGVWEPK